MYRHLGTRSDSNDLMCCFRRSISLVLLPFRPARRPSDRQSGSWGDSGFRNFSGPDDSLNQLCRTASLPSSPVRTIRPEAPEKKWSQRHFPASRQVGRPVGVFNWITSIRGGDFHPKRRFLRKGEIFQSPGCFLTDGATVPCRIARDSGVPLFHCAVDWSRPE